MSVQVVIVSKFLFFNNDYNHNSSVDSTCNMTLKILLNCHVIWASLTHSRKIGCFKGPPIQSLNSIMYKPGEAGLKRFVHNAPDRCSPMHYSLSQTKSPDSHCVCGARGRTDNRRKSLLKKTKYL